MQPLHYNEPRISHHSNSINPMLPQLFLTHNRPLNFLYFSHSNPTFRTETGNLPVRLVLHGTPHSVSDGLLSPRRFHQFLMHNYSHHMKVQLILLSACSWQIYASCYIPQELFWNTLA